MATQEASSHPFSRQERDAKTTPFIDQVLECLDDRQPKITSGQISRYAELASLVSQLEAQKEALRAELLTLHKVGAEQETGSPYLLNFVEQGRRVVDWKNQAFALAEELYGVERAATWKCQVEQAAPVTPVDTPPQPLIDGK